VNGLGLLEMIMGEFLKFCSFISIFRWAQSILIIACLVSAVFFNIYAHNVVAEEQALAHFGNNRIKIMSERRKIKFVIF
jgi:hypothetical protein